MNYSKCFRGVYWQDGNWLLWKPVVKILTIKNRRFGVLGNKTLLIDSGCA